MPAEPQTAAEVDVAEATSRCGCGRLAMARCWLGEHSPARWLVGCQLPIALRAAPADETEAARRQLYRRAG